MRFPSSDPCRELMLPYLVDYLAIERKRERESFLREGISGGTSSGGRGFGVKTWPETKAAEHYTGKLLRTAC